MTEVNTNFTIAIIDDDEDFRFNQKTQLEAAGYKVVEADCKEQAEELFQAGGFDLAILDLMMEEEDSGFTLCFELKKRMPNIPVIMVTGVAAETGLGFDVETREERSWIKADVLLDKPIRFEQLRGEIERLLA